MWIYYMTTSFALHISLPADMIVHICHVIIGLFWLMPFGLLTLSAVDQPWMEKQKLTGR